MLILDPTSTVAENARVEGGSDIRVGKGSVIHPYATLSAIYGPITIGEHCIINEQSLIKPGTSDGITIEDCCIVDVNARVHGRQVGRASLLEAGCRIGKDAVIGQNCKITSLNVVSDGQTLQDHTIVYGENKYRQETEEDPALREWIVKQCEALHQILPKYNTIRV